MPAEGGYPQLVAFEDDQVPHLPGNGTEGDPYLLATAEELGMIRYGDCTACYRLISDIDLTGIATRLRRSAGSTLDYLRWLIEVDLIRREGRRYRFADPILRLHVLLHEVPERPPDSEGRRSAVDRFLATLHDEPIPLRPLGRPRGARGVRAGAPAGAAGGGATAARKRPPAPARDDSLIEID